MKWLGLLFLVALVPVLTAWLRGRRDRARYALFAIGFLAFTIGWLDLYIAPVSWAGWPGFVKGMEITLLDSVALALWLSAPRTRHGAWVAAPYAFYIACVLLSAGFSPTPTASAFYAWQLGRMLLVALAISAACRSPEAMRTILAGLVAGLGLQAVLAVKDSINGVLQTGGSFGHQNTLGMISHFVVFPVLAILLASKRGGWLWLGPAAGAVVVILGASRATIGLAGAGCALLILFSLILRSTSRKAGVAVLALLLFGTAAPLAFKSLDRRFDGAAISFSGDGEREAFERAASAMFRDHPLGVGANQYVIVANTQGYYDRAGVAWRFESRSAHVHHAYWLVAAETGLLGLAGFMSILLAPLFSAVRNAFRYRRDQRGEVLLGLAVAIVVVMTHSFFEWVLVSFNVQYFLAIATGLIAALVRQLRASGAGGTVSRARRPVLNETPLSEEPLGHSTRLPI